MKKYIAYLADLQCVVAKPVEIDNVVRDRLGFVNLYQRKKRKKRSSADKMKPKINWGKQSKQAL